MAATAAYAAATAVLIPRLSSKPTRCSALPQLPPRLSSSSSSFPLKQYAGIHVHRYTFYVLTQMGSFFSGSCSQRFEFYGWRLFLFSTICHGWLVWVSLQFFRVFVEICGCVISSFSTVADKKSEKLKAFSAEFWFFMSGFGARVLRKFWALLHLLAVMHCWALLNVLHCWRLNVVTKLISLILFSFTYSAANIKQMQIIRL